MADRAPSDKSSPREIHIAIYQIKNWEKGNPNFDTEIQKASLSLAALRKRDSLKDIPIGSSFILVHDSPLAARDKYGFNNILQLNRAMAKRVEEIRDPFPEAPMYSIFPHSPIFCPNLYLFRFIFLGMKRRASKRKSMKWTRNAKGRGINPDLFPMPSCKGQGVRRGRISFAPKTCNGHLMGT